MSGFSVPESAQRVGQNASPSPRHALLVNPLLHGPEYGMLRDLESAIVGSTRAIQVPLPFAALERGQRSPLGTRWAWRRRLAKRERLEINADVLWVVCMGPENHLLDLIDLRLPKGAKKILYLFDTLPNQLESIRYACKDIEWDLLVTAFPDAVEWLSRWTGLRWHWVAQGVLPERFPAAPVNQRLIGFCSYGRRVESVHRQVNDWAIARNVAYDFQTSAKVRADVPCDDLYRQYAWHLGHSLFSICWPVETTHPTRAGFLKPLTCRWFEAAMAGAVIVGSEPDLPQFREFFPAGLVHPLAASGQIAPALDALWSDRARLSAAAADFRASFASRWSWYTRVAEIKALLAA